MKLIVTIERPDGTTYEQQIEYRNSVKESIEYFQNKILGNPYIYENNKKTNKFKQDAYLVCNWRLV